MRELGAHRHFSSSRKRPRSKVDLCILAAGLLAAVASGVIAYRIGGPYGNGFRRISHPATGRGELVYESESIQAAYSGDGRLGEIRYDSDSNGTIDTWTYVDGTRVDRVELDPDEDGRVDRWEYYNAAQQLEKVGFSLAGDGVVDAWAYQGPDGQIAKIEVSTGRDGTVDRWEYYDNDEMVRMEADTTGDGQVDKWETYANGVLTTTAYDEDGDGRPDRRLLRHGGGDF